VSLNQREESTTVVWLVGSVSIFVLMFTMVISIGAREPGVTIAAGLVELFAGFRMRTSREVMPLRIIVLASGVVTLVAGLTYHVMR
jgi:hypothetical protein